MKTIQITITSEKANSTSEAIGIAITAMLNEAKLDLNKKQHAINGKGFYIIIEEI